MEYECARGHRFLSSAPDRLMKQGSNPNRETSAAKVVNADMPLYMACPCRSVGSAFSTQVCQMCGTLSSFVSISISLGPYSIEEY